MSKYITAPEKFGTNKLHRQIVCEYYGWSSIPKIIHVHHVNGDSLDNRIENLAVLTISEHFSLHHKGKQHRLGHKRSNEEKLKISKSMKGVKKTEDHKKNISAGKKGIATTFGKAHGRYGKGKLAPYYGVIKKLRTENGLTYQQIADKLKTDFSITCNPGSINELFLRKRI